MPKLTPYYDHRGITLYHSRWEDVLPSLPADGFDLVFTSPPYNLGNTSGGGFPAPKMGHYSETATCGNKRGGCGKWSRAALPGGLSEGYGEHSDAMPHEEYVSWQQTFLRECWRLIHESGAVYYNHKPRVLNGVLVSPFAYLPPELPVRQVVIWARAGGINFSAAFYLPTHEWIVILAKPYFRLKSKGASGPGDVWRIDQETGTQHPAPFPLELPARAIETAGCHSILDPFCGSGTTLRAAKDAGIKAVGIEVSEAYCAAAVKRLEQDVFQWEEPNV